MTPTQAKQTFADLMKKARTPQGLTERDRVRLADARQLLRRAKRPAMNPRVRRSSLQRIGTAKEVRYHRSIGRKPGFYKHTIRSRSAGVYTIPPGWVYVGSKSILITEKTPKV